MEVVTDPQELVVHPLEVLVDHMEVVADPQELVVHPLEVLVDHKFW
jgi:hypothetical protein